MTEEEKEECREIALILQTIAPALFLYAMSEVEEFGGMPGDVLKALLRAQHTAYAALARVAHAQYGHRLQAVEDRWAERFNFPMWAPREDFDDMLEKHL